MPRFISMENTTVFLFVKQPLAWHHKSPPRKILANRFSAWFFCCWSSSFSFSVSIEMVWSCQMSHVVSILKQICNEKSHKWLAIVKEMTNFLSCCNLQWFKWCVDFSILLSVKWHPSKSFAHVHYTFSLISTTTSIHVSIRLIACLSAAVSVTW